MALPIRSSLLGGSTARRRIAYSVAAGTAVGAADGAQALVIYSGIENQEIVQGLEAFHLRIDPDDFIDVALQNYVFNPGGVPTNYQGIFMPYGPSGFVGFGPSGGFDYARALAAGYEVNQANTTGQCGEGGAPENCFDGPLAYGGVAINAQFLNVENAFIGFRFMTNIQPNWDLRIPHYGWARVSINNAEGTFTLHEWAYESEPNTPILTGDRGAAGDFNDDGKVDAADYTVWRDNLGTDHILAGHGDEVGDSVGIVDYEDYALWKAAYGWQAPNTGGDSIVAPEPGALGLLAAGSLGLLALRRRN